MIRRALRNKPFMLLLPAFILIQLLVYMTSHMLPYLLTYVVVSKEKSAETWLSYNLLALEVGAVISIPVWRQIAQKYGKRLPFLLGWGMVIVTGIIGLAFCSRGNEVIFCVVLFFEGASAGGWALLFYSMQADVIDYDMLYTGDRREAQFITFWTIIPRLIAIPAAALPLQIMSFAGYVPNQIQQSPAAEWTIKTLALIIPVSLALVCFVLMIYYPIGEKVHIEIQKGVEKLKKGQDVQDPITGLLVDHPPSAEERKRRELLDYFSVSELNHILGDLLIYFLLS
jgi:Na+/melibiose symporter-like transporter